MEQRRRARVVLIVLIAVALVLITVDFRSEGDGPIDRLRAGATAVLRPIQDGVVTLVRPVGEAVTGIGDLFSTRAENEELRERIEALEQRRRSVVDIERENDELRELLEIRDAIDSDTIAARVVAFAPSTFEWTITLDVGSDDGVRRGMPVIDGDGLVGRVVQVSSRASRALLAIDPNFSAAARLAVNGEIGPIEGRGSEPMVFRPLDPEVVVEVGDEVVSSAYQGGLFPAGIPIGTVSDVGDTGVMGLRREVQVQPFVDFTRLHHVLVVVHEQVEDLPPLSSTPDEPFVPPDVPPFIVPGTDDPDDDDPDDDDPDDDDPGDDDPTDDDPAPDDDRRRRGRDVIARTLLLGVLLLAAAVLQTALLPLLGLTGFRPDLLLLVALGVALHDGPLAGLRVGSAAGLLTDLLLLQSPVGLATLVVATIGFMVGAIRPYLASDSLTAPVLITFVASTVGTFVFGVLALLLGDDRSALAVLVEASLGVGFATTLLAPLVVWPIRGPLDRYPVRGASVSDDL